MTDNTNTEPFMLGVFPPPLEDFVPERFETQVALLAGTLSTLVITEFLFPGESGLQLTAAATAIAGGWLYNRWNTRHHRGNVLFDKPYNFLPVAKQAAPDHANWQVTELLRQRTGIQELIVTEGRSEQYRILKIPNFDPKRIEAQLPAVSMKLGIDEQNLKWMQNFEPGVSAILAPLPPNEWQDVLFDDSVLVPGKLIASVGKGVNGEPIAWDHEIEPHGKVAGGTNSGKTVFIRNHMRSMRLSGLNPEIYILDPKEDLEDEPCDHFTSDLNTGADWLESICARGDARKARYKQAGCNNYFEYQRKVDSKERPIFVYMDEGADWLSKDLTEELEEGQHPRHKRIMESLKYIARKLRAAGVFLIFIIQHPKADLMDTHFRSQLGASVVFSVVDRKASEVALDQGGAETLPKFGAFYFKTSLSNAPILGRAAKQ